MNRKPDELPVTNVIALNHINYNLDVGDSILSLTTSQAHANGAAINMPPLSTLYYQWCSDTKL